MIEEIKAKELKLWQKYKDSRFKDQDTLQELLISTKPIRLKSISRWQGPVPQSIMEAESIILTKKALENYNPTKAALGTHITNQLQPLSRLAYSYANLAKIPEPRLLKYNTYQNAEANLKDRLGREPSALELAEELTWPLAEIERFRKESYRDIFQEEIPSLYSFEQTSPTQDFLNYLYFESDNNTKRLMEYVFGFGGKPLITENEELAQKLRLPVTEIVRMKKELTSRIKEM